VLLNIASIGDDENMKIQARFLGLQSYTLLLRDMRRFTTERDQRTTDEIWVVEHPPVFTRGQRESDGDVNSIEVSGMGPVPVIASDRGGLITYHGPGQMIFYVLIDLKRSGVGIRRLVAALEQAIIDLLRAYGIAGSRIQGAPGVYVDDAKIASLGLRVRNGCTYHGLSLNVDMSMAPFEEIDPCGVVGQKMTLLRALGVEDSFELIAEKVCRGLSERLGYTVYNEIRAIQGDRSDGPEAEIVEDQPSWLGSALTDGIGAETPQLAAPDSDTNAFERESMLSSSDDLTAGSRSDDEDGLHADDLRTLPGSNLLSHLTSLGDTPDPKPTPTLTEKSSKDDSTAYGRLPNRRLSSVTAAVSDPVSQSDEPHKDQIRTEFERIVNSELDDNELPEPDTSLVEDGDVSDPPKVSMANFVRTDDDLGFLKPSNLHELIKDNGRED